MNRKQRQSDVLYWLDFSSKCRPRLIPWDVCNPYSPWATSGMLCHRGVLHGLHALHRDPLYLTSGRGLLTGPLEISFHLKITRSGQKPTSSPPPSTAGYSFLCECRQMSHLHLLSIFHIWWERCVSCWGGLRRDGGGKESLQAPLCNCRMWTGWTVSFSTFQVTGTRGPASL